jgi:aldehyde:ferredoxin oxidoreductase
VSIQEAGHFWGRNTKETQEMIRAELGDNKIRVSLIGPALADKNLDPEKIDKAKKYYYALMGWDERGVPLPEKVDELSIDYEC